MTARNASLPRTRYISHLHGERGLHRPIDRPARAGLANRSRSDPIQPRAEHHRQDKTTAHPAAGSVAQKVRAEIMVMQRARGEGERERREGKTGIWSGPRVIIARAGKVFPSALRPSAPRQRSTMTNWSCGGRPIPPGFLDRRHRGLRIARPASDRVVPRRPVASSPASRTWEFLGCQEP